MSWTYRIVCDTDNSYSIREVYFDALGAITGWAEKPAAPIGEDVGGLMVDLRIMLAAYNRPVLFLVEGKLVEKP